MRDFLATLGVILLILVVWFLFDFPSFLKAVTAAHHAQLQRQISNELDSPQKLQVNGVDYLIIPVK